MRLLKTFGLTVFLTLFVTSQVMPPLIGWQEVFPFFHWSLFSITQGEHWQYVIYFPHQKCELKECSFLRQEAKDEQVYWLVQDLGRNFEEKSSEFHLLKNQFEQLVLPKNLNIEYELRLRKSNPADYVLVGKVIEEKAIGQFKGEVR